MLDELAAAIGAQRDDEAADASEDEEAAAVVLVVSDELAETDEADEQGAAVVGVEGHVLVERALGVRHEHVSLLDEDCFEPLQLALAQGHRVTAFVGTKR